MLMIIQLKSMALIPDIDRLSTEEDCFKIDVGFFYGDIVGFIVYRRISWLFFPMSTGTGFISTFEFLRFFKVGESKSSTFCCFWTGDEVTFGPQLRSLELAIISGGLFAEF